ncbi:MAG TPA: phage/plasmid primase, P4 family, partial [Desulfobacterales bacterium]|nr:phage/plasmid primase, P4 family [Desulfobacterales bacterium]
RAVNAPRTLLESALALAATGWGVLPLHTPVGGVCDCRRPDCSSPGKHPRTKNGLTDATIDTDQIEKWWTMWPHANVGIAVPSGVVAVDVDGPEGVSALDAGGYSLPETATVETGRGHHYLYQTSEKLGPKAAILTKVDLRGVGSYLVAPPSLHYTGREYRWLRDPAEGLAEAPEWIGELVGGSREPDGHAPSIPELIVEGQRNTTLTSLAGSMRRRGASAEVILAALLEANRLQCRPPLDEREIRTIAMSIGRKPPGEEFLRRADERRFSDLDDEQAALGVVDEDATLAQVGHLSRQSLAAYHFVERKGAEVRFDHGRRIWLVWHGHRWRPDRDQEVRRLWLEVLGSRYQEAVKITDSEMRDRTLAAITAAGATDEAISAGLRITASMKPTATSGDAWDLDPWILGCENGLVDLRTGALRVGRPADMVSRSTKLDYDPRATCPRWDRFLQEVFAADEDLVGWFAMLIGASLVGTSKELLAVHYGSGNNGKSVAFRTLGREVAGDYSVEIAVETLLNANRAAGAPTSDLMRLRGARLAFTSEPERGAKFRGGTLKRLATIDLMTGRELHGRQEEWPPTHTLHLATNHLPAADDASEGFWRRIALIPWAVRFAKRGEAGYGPFEDPGLFAILAGEAPGILAWAVRGAVAYATVGTLHPLPASVARETAAYREDEDPLGGFLREWVVGQAGASTAGPKVYEQYLAWAESIGSKPMTAPVFGRAFTERHDHLGFPVRRRKVHGSPVYEGLVVARPAE